MTKQQIVEIIRRYKPEMEMRYGVRRLGLFGSYVRGSQSNRSDVDILVSFSRDVDLFDFLDLREYLENKLRQSVDLVLESALKPSIGKHILSEVEDV